MRPRYLQPQSNICLFFTTDQAENMARSIILELNRRGKTGLYWINPAVQNTGKSFIRGYTLTIKPVGAPPYTVLEA